MTLETQKYAAAAGSFCFVTTENGDQQDMCNLITMRRVYNDHCTSMKGPTTPAARKLKFGEELTVQPETCWNAVWLPAERQQEQGPK